MSDKMRLHLLVIDPQNSFCDPNGSLYVPGADEDMKRLAGLVTRLQNKLDDIHVTMDSHRLIDISHPSWWKDSSGNHPSPFTIITVADMKDGRWTTTLPSASKRTLHYLQELERRQRYAHCIWPPHCLIGDEGHCVFPELAASIREWESKRFAMTDFVTKGSNPWTEHFSAVQAEVPDPEDPSTQINSSLISTLERADIILLAGQARSHCMANTVRDVAANFGDPSYVRKLVLLTDCTSDVPGFEHLGNEFLADLQKLGMQTSTTADFLK
jgi:nicotinamidase-related amidase